MELTFDHIAISTDDIHGSISFYREQFPGTEVLYEDESWGYLRCGGIKIALVRSSEHPPHISFRLASRGELVEYAERSGGKIVLHRDGTESFYIYDSSENAIEIIWYPEGGMMGAGQAEAPETD